MVKRYTEPVRVTFLNKGTAERRYYIDDADIDAIREHAKCVGDADEEAIFARRNGYLMMAQRGQSLYSLMRLEGTDENIWIAKSFIDGNNKGESFSVVPFNYSEEGIDVDRILSAATKNYIRGGPTEFLLVLQQDLFLYTLGKVEDRFVLPLISGNIFPIGSVSQDEKAFVEAERNRLHIVVEEARRMIQEKRQFIRGFVAVTHRHGYTVRDFFYLLQ